MTRKLAASSNKIEVDIHHSITKFSKKDIQIKNVLMLLKNCNWFSEKIPYDTITVQQNEMAINITPTQVKIWKDDIEQQESVIATRQRNLLDIHQQQTSTPVARTLTAEELNNIHSF